MLNIIVTALYLCIEICVGVYILCVCVRELSQHAVLQLALLLLPFFPTGLELICLNFHCHGPQYLEVREKQYDQKAYLDFFTVSSKHT